MDKMAFLRFASCTFSTDRETARPPLPLVYTNVWWRGFTFSSSLRGFLPSAPLPRVLGESRRLPLSGLVPLTPRQPPGHVALTARVSSWLLRCLNVGRNVRLFWDVICRSANLKREDKADRKEDTKKGEDVGGEKSKDQDDQKPGPSERSRTTKSGAVTGDVTLCSVPGWCGLRFAVSSAY